MPSRYHPLEDSLWDDAKLEGMTFEGHAFFAFLFANRRQRPSGIYRATDEQLAVDTGERKLGLTVRQVQWYISELHRRGRIVRDGAWVFVRNYLKRQPKHERLLGGVRYDIENCDSIPILEAFSEQYPLYSKWSTDRLETVRRSMNGFGFHNSNPNHNPTRTTKHTEEGGGPPSSYVPSGAEWSGSTPESLAALYNQEAPAYLPRVEEITDGRRKKAAALLAKYPDRSWWDRVFAEYHTCRFLYGQERSNGHSHFKPDFDWLIGKDKQGRDNALKVHEGKYRDTVMAQPPKTQQTLNAIGQFLEGGDRPW